MIKTLRTIFSYWLSSRRKIFLWTVIDFFNRIVFIIFLSDRLNLLIGFLLSCFFVCRSWIQISKSPEGGLFHNFLNYFFKLLYFSLTYNLIIIVSHIDLLYQYFIDYFRYCVNIILVSEFLNKPFHTNLIKKLVFQFL